MSSNKHAQNMVTKTCIFFFRWDSSQGAWIFCRQKMERLLETDFMELPGFVASKKWIFKIAARWCGFTCIYWGQFQHIYIFFPSGTSSIEESTSTIWIKNRTLEGWNPQKIREFDTFGHAVFSTQFLKFAICHHGAWTVQMELPKASPNAWRCWASWLL